MFNLSGRNVPLGAANTTFTYFWFVFSLLALGSRYALSESGSCHRDCHATPCLPSATVDSEPTGAISQKSIQSPISCPGHGVLS